MECTQSLEITLRIIGTFSVTSQGDAVLAIEDHRLEHEVVELLFDWEYLASENFDKIIH